MEEENEIKVEPEVDLDAEAEIRLERLHYRRELRGLELRAYSGVLEALRASGKPSPEKDTLIKTLRDFFNISEDRHKSELRLLAYDDKLSLISEKLNGYDFSSEWAFLAQRVYVPFGPQAFSLYRSYPANVTKNCPVIVDPVPSGKSKDTAIFEDDSDLDSDSELEWIETLIKENITSGLQTDKQKPFTVAVETGTGNEEEIEEIEAQAQMKKLKNSAKKQQYTPPKSPDITEAPKTPTRGNASRKENRQGVPIKARSLKRKNIDEPIPPPPPVENSVVYTSKKLKEKSKNILKIKKPNRSQPKIKIAPRKEPKKAKESSEETSSADEGENGPLPVHLDESSRVMSPVFSEVIRSSVLSKGGRGKVEKGRGNTDRRRNNAVTNPKVKGKSRARPPSQKSAKLKNSMSSSGSRRKSKLNEKIDYDDLSIDIDRNEAEKQWLPPSQYHEVRNSADEISRRVYLDNQIPMYDRIGDSRMPTKEYKPDDYAVYLESLPANYNHADMEQVTDGVFKRPLPPSKGPKHWEIKDARLNHHCFQDEPVSDENVSGSNIPGEHEEGSPTSDISSHQNSMNCTTDSSYNLSNSPKSYEQSPPSKKQRIKSPLIVNPNINPPNVSKVPLATPVFSTSLSSVNKKRQNSKPMSVVDSLNLHLPTSATASSLAASSNNRRPGAIAGGGCSMFSNSSALIAGARGTAPGILQQQRKAQPHILSNSKVQRTFLPSVNPCSVPNNAVSINNNNIVPISSTPIVSVASSPITPNSAAVTATAQAVQIPSSSIPISVTPSNTIHFPNFSGSNATSVSLGSPGVPIGHVNRSVAGTNIIFFQKPNGPTVGVGAGAAVPNNVIPVKTPPRAVILRRAQIPRQGNVMILDMQKNQLVGSGQPSPILQTARVLNAPGELSVLNMQSNISPRKSTSPTVSTNQTSPSSVMSLQPIFPSSPTQIQDSGIVIGTSHNPESFVAISGPSQVIQLSNSALSSEQQEQKTAMLEAGKVMIPASGEENSLAEVEEGAQDAQYAQIEAELMQMEQGGFEEVVYEEEVTTEIVPLEEAGTTQYIYTNDAIPTTEGEVLLAVTTESTHNASATSGSSTDTASENETSTQNFESPESDLSRQKSVTKVSISPMKEVKLASEAISRALSLSKTSPAKKLTFSPSLGTATSLSGNFTLSSKSNQGLEVPIVSTSQTQVNVLPGSVKSAATNLKSTSVLLERDSASTNTIHIGKPAIGPALNANELQQSSQLQLQESSNPS